MEKVWSEGDEFAAVGLSLSAEEFHAIGNVLMRAVNLAKENHVHFPLTDVETELIAEFLK
jgi:hypothetical protein